MRRHLQVLVGMIASGKSTYAANAARAGAVVVSDDAIVTAVHGGDYRLYDPGLKSLYKAAENTLIQHALAVGRAVVVDRGLNVRRRARRRLLALADAVDAEAVAVVFPRAGATEHADRRAAADPRGRDRDYWLRVASAHEAEFDEPDGDEGFAAVHRPAWADIGAGWVCGGPGDSFCTEGVWKSISATGACPPRC